MKITIMIMLSVRRDKRNIEKKMFDSLMKMINDRR